MNKPVFEKHHGVKVWTNVKTDVMRRSECLCLNCKNIEKCKTAKQLYEICKGTDIAMCITRCPRWSDKEAANVTSTTL